MTLRKIRRGSALLSLPILIVLVGTIAVAVFLTLKPKILSTPGASAMPSGIALGSYKPAYPNDLSSVVAYESESGKKLSIIHWYAIWGGWKSVCSTSDLNIVKNRGSLPMITWEPWDGTNNSSNNTSWNLQNKILSGSSNTYIDSWADCLKNYGSPLLLRFAHEMNNQPSYPWSIGHNGNTAADYVNAWKYVWNRFAAKGVTNVRWVWNPNTTWGTDIPSYESVYSSVYPGDSYVDWIGLDIYNTAGLVGWGPTSWTELNNILQSPYTAITTVSPNKPLVLGEISSTEATGHDKGAWITNGLGSALPTSFPAVHAVVWFDINKELNWTIASSTSSHNAFINTWKLSQYDIDINSFLSGGGISPISTPVSTAAPMPTLEGITFTSVSAVAITSNQAAIIWNTNQASTSQITYGNKTNSINQYSALNPTFVTSHSVVLSGLSRGKTYYYQVISKDINGTNYTSSIFSFKTPR